MFAHSFFIIFLIGNDSVEAMEQYYRVNLNVSNCTSVTYIFKTYVPVGRAVKSSVVLYVWGKFPFNTKAPEP